MTDASPENGEIFGILKQLLSLEKWKKVHDIRLCMTDMKMN